MKKKLKKRFRQIVITSQSLIASALIAGFLFAIAPIFTEGTLPVIAEMAEREITEADVMNWLDEQAELSTYVQDRLELAEETFKRDFKEQKIDQIKLKLDYDGEVTQEDISRAERNARIITNQEL